MNKIAIKTLLILVICSLIFILIMGFLVNYTNNLDKGINELAKEKNLTVGKYFPYPEAYLYEIEEGKMRKYPLELIGKKGYIVSGGENE